MCMRTINITLDEAFNQKNCCECANVLITGSDGIKKSRIVTIESLLKAIQSSFTAQRVYMPVGEMPFGYYDAQIGEDQGRFCADAVMVLPAGKHLIQYEQTRYDVPLPSMVFQFKVDRQQITSTYVYVIKDKKLTDKSKLYRYPFGNVNQSGRVCWGKNKLPDIRELKELEEAVMLFIQSPSNSDYYESKVYCNHEGLSLRQLLEMLKDEEEYPQDYLVSIWNNGKNMVLGNLVPWKNKR